MPSTHRLTFHGSSYDPSLYEDARPALTISMAWDFNRIISRMESQIRCGKRMTFSPSHGIFCPYYESLWIPYIWIEFAEFAKKEILNQASGGSKDEDVAVR